MTEFYNPSMVVTAMSWHEVSDKLAHENINKIEDLLNKKILLLNYGENVSQLTFIFICDLPSKSLHQEETTYLEDEKKLLIYRRLPYQKVKTYTKEEVLRLMAETYVKGISELWAMAIPNFNYFQLAQDIQKIFIELGWVISDSFYPISRKVKATTVAAFLYSKGWKEKSKTKRYQIMLPPKDQKELKDRLLFIPLLPDSEPDTYQRAWSDLIVLISNIYKIDRLELELLFAKNTTQIKENIDMMVGMLEQ